MIPAGQGLVGKFIVSGKRVPIFCKQVYVSYLNFLTSSLLRAMESPMSMRNPCLKAVTFDFCW
jgi:hypothetical protein